MGDITAAPSAIIIQFMCQLQLWYHVSPLLVTSSLVQSLLKSLCWPMYKLNLKRAPRTKLQRGPPPTVYDRIKLNQTPVISYCHPVIFLSGSQTDYCSLMSFSRKYIFTCAMPAHSAYFGLKFQDLDASASAKYKPIWCQGLAHSQHSMQMVMQQLTPLLIILGLKF